MREIGIFEVKKGTKCGIVNVPRRTIGKQVKVLMLDDKDHKSQVDHRITIIENQIRNLEFQKESLRTLRSIRKRRREMGIK